MELQLELTATTEKNEWESSLILYYLFKYRVNYKHRQSPTISNPKYFLLTPWSRVLLEKLIGSQLFKNSPRILWNRKVHCRVSKSPPSVPILSQIKPVHTLTSYFLKINFMIILPFTPRPSKCFFPSGFRHQGMARTPIVNAGTASSMEDSCGYTE
jgi:hypothetical protein